MATTTSRYITKLDGKLYRTVADDLMQYLMNEEDNTKFLEAIVETIVANES